MSWIRRETEKGAVQYICPHCHDYHEFREDFGGRTFSENYIFCRRCGARNGTGNAPTLTPPNEPLTLEQLRQMEGQWIIIKAFDAEISGIMPAFIKDRFATTLCELGSKAIIPDLCEAHFSFNEYGKTWIAYDRPPEGKENTK